MAVKVVHRAIVEISVNGQAHRVEVDPVETLLSVLRIRLGLTGTKEGCAIGVCGLCTVLLDGAPIAACLLPAVRASGRRVTTIEGLARPDGPLTRLQEAFINRGGLQCGICTPGQIVTATALLAAVETPTEADVVAWLGGNLCRCTGYYGIIDAVLTASGGDRPSCRPPVRAVELPLDADNDPSI
jgi:aerobic-type carbon monoxide dehydrogenase small subunit (CoxS/CutS family)